MTDWRLLYEEMAFYELQDLPEAPRRKMTEALENFAATGAGNVKSLTGPWRRHLRLRVGDYRAILSRETDGAGGYHVVKTVFTRGDGY